ncbi:hypothetical protein GEMRC1_002999 [Eukaryota sp. GEM-RC1]
MSGSQRQSSSLFFISVAGVYISYLFFGIFQEHITKSPFHDDQYFQFYTFLVLVLCFFNCVISRVCIAVVKGYSAQLRHMPKLPYFKISVSYISAMLASNISLFWLPYPSQVLLKSCKMIPVLLAGVFIRKVKYPILKYVSVGLLTLGIVSFMLSGKSSGAAMSNQVVWPGIVLGFISLTFDGLTSALQDSVVAKYKCTAFIIMYLTNFFGVFIMGFVCLFSNEFFPAISFIHKNPELLLFLIGIGVFSAVGQSCIYMLISRHSSLVCATVTTTRKFFTLLISVALFDNALLPQQWLSVGCVFGGILLEKLAKVYQKRKKLHTFQSNDSFNSNFSNFPISNETSKSKFRKVTLV